MWLQKHRSKLSLMLFTSALIVALEACTPSYTVEQSQLYARKTGLTNQYEVSRWHNRRIPASSRILIAVTAKTELDTASLNEAIRLPMTANFSVVETLGQTTSLAQARRQAKKQQFDFIFDVNRILTENGSNAENEGKSEAADSKEESVENEQKDTSIGRIQLEIALVDVVSGDTIDKFKVTANTSFFNPIGTDLRDLLAEPMEQLAEDLAGH